MIFHATKAKVEDQGHPPDDFLDTLVTWAKGAPSSIFTINDSLNDIMPRLLARLGNDKGQWDNLLHRKAALVELMRVHSGFESGWNWKEGVDTTNPRSVANPKGQETGIFQVSYDSLYLDRSGLLEKFAQKFLGDSFTVKDFIVGMKKDTNHNFALEYYAMLVRINYRWAGPLIRLTGDSVYPWLSRASMREFLDLIT